MIILGIDPGYAILGYGLIEKRGSKLIHIKNGVIKTPANLEHAKRLLLIYNELQSIFQSLEIAEIAIEKIFFSNNTKTAINVAQARGIALLVAEQFSSKIYEYTPPQIKTGVSGYGKADKQQVQTMVKMLLKLDKIPKPDDAADALAVAICHAHSLKLQSAY